MRPGRSRRFRAVPPPGAVAYFELVGVATKHLSPTLVAVSVAL